MNDKLLCNNVNERVPEATTKAELLNNKFEADQPNRSTVTLR